MSVRPVQKKGEGTGGIGPRAGRKVNGTIVMMRDITIRGIPRVTRLAIRSRVIRMKIIWQPGENPGSGEHSNGGQMMPFSDFDEFYKFFFG